MKFYKDKNELDTLLSGVVEISEGKVSIIDKEKIRERLIDSLVYNSVFNKDPNLRKVTRSLIREIGTYFGIVPSSIHSFYLEKGKGKYLNMTVPAINIRGLTYDIARAVFSSAKKLDVGAFIFEIARSEMEYTEQAPDEYACVVIGAGIKEGFSGPLFIQGDHFQIRKRLPNDIENLKVLMKESIDAGFYNIDLDTSVLVDLGKLGVYEQQRPNFEAAAILCSYIRDIEPEGITISLGGEIGEIGGKNSTEEELREYMRGFLNSLPEGKIGISKMAVQTGTVHGGIPLPDGGVADVALDFETLAHLSSICKEYGLAGTVQHGASTLPIELFDKFPETDTAEVHLATEFQNMVYELIPDELSERIYSYLKEACASERKETETETQFIYKTRKKAFGPFKKDFWNLSEDIRKNIREKLADKFSIIFERLKVSNTREIIQSTVCS
ncbi:TPA: aldolase [bacterium]|nr:aldolase [bacterium]